jgi:hypothetical protein
MFHAKLLAVRRRVAQRFKGGFDPYPPAPDGASLSPSSAHDPRFDAAPLRLSFARAGIADPAGWQREARAKLADLTGYGRAESVPKARFETEAGLSGGLVRRRSYLRVAEGADVPVDVVIPAAPVELLPAMICLQGTNSGAHLSWGEARMPADPIKIANGSDYARQAVAHGYAAICVEQSCFGERREQRLRSVSADPCIDTANHALLLGRTLVGERASDVSAVVDWLAAGGAGAGVDGRRVYAMGNSSGGTTAVYAAALDPRIAGIVAGGCVGLIRETLARRANSSGQNTIPGILEWLEFDDVLALIAPRPLLAISGDADHIWPFAGVERAVDGARAVYAAIGAENALAAMRAQGGHRFYPDLAWDGFRRLVDAAGA